MLIPLLLIAYLQAPAAPTDEPPPPRIEILAEITAYTSSPNETDDTPDINASGTRPTDGSIACPRYYPFGTQFVIQGKRYTCDDRMNKRHADRFDIWMPNRSDALEFGVQTLPIEIASTYDGRD